LVSSVQKPFTGTALVPLVYMFEIPFYPEERGSRFLRNIGNVLSDYTVSHPRRQ
jgi:hypothetical protein